MISDSKRSSHKGGTGILKFILIGSLIVLITFFIYFEPFRAEPYDPNVEIDGKQVPTVQGSYCWSSLFSGRCVDMIYVNALHMTEKSNSVIVSPNEKIHLSFEREPDTLKIVRWDTKTKSEKVSFKNEYFKAPTDQGTYTYEINARWNENGSGVSAFLIQVE
ncbi:hypothetical protein [uncultured Exiguobacterium sp.]|uniref:hypothetical protein n=1 Tax=uncultured Exiguobacterium sp. TaxID=202669 RepID=UPI0025F02239|nr:hypothetical protein [uncultured Exiguobacterium sp.]